MFLVGIMNTSKIMKVIRTYKTKIAIPQDRIHDVERLFQSIQQIFNLHTEWAYQHKSYSKRLAHKELYHAIKEQFPGLPVQYIQSTRDQALEAVKRIVKHQKASEKWTGTVPKKKLWSAIRLVNGCTITFRMDKVTFSCYGKRVTLQLNLSSYHVHTIKDLQFHAAQLRRDKQGNFWLYLQFKKEIREVEIPPNPRVLGIDVGVYNLLALSDGTLIKAKEFKRIKRRYQYLRQKLQAKGTRSAKRLLKHLSGKESRFSYNFCHALAKTIANLPYDVFVLEDLSALRKSKSYSKKANRMVNSYMPYGMFCSLLSYKAEELSKRVVKVNPAYTSVTCSICGSRNTHRCGAKFKCNNCGYQCHADINAAQNIKAIFLSSLDLGLIGRAPSTVHTHQT